MFRSLFGFAAGLILLGCSVVSAQSDSGRARSMNVEDRINELSESNDSGYGDNGRSPTAAGAYPMNTMDRINATRSSRSPARAPAAKAGPLPKDARTAGGAVATPSLKDRPDAWRYLWHENRWWYYSANSRWLYWTGNHWNSFAAAPATEKDATGVAH